VVGLVSKAKGERLAFDLALKWFSRAGDATSSKLVAVHWKPSDAGL